MSRLKLTIVGVVACAALACVGLLALSARSKGPLAQTSQAGSSWSLHPHPHVVVALAPGEAPPVDAQPVDTSVPDQWSVGNSGPSSPPSPSSGPDPATFRPPSDAEVKRELRQLHVLGFGGSGAYVNPFSQVRGLVPERIDMGVDYSGSGPVLALGSGVVFNTAGPGWPGGAFIGIVLDSGPFARRAYYIAEDVTPTVRVGEHVLAGQMIGSMYNGGSGIETGWAAGRGDEPLAAALSQQSPGDPGGWSSAAGISFDRLLVSAGAPSGIPQGSGSHGRMPPGYP